MEILDKSHGRITYITETGQVMIEKEANHSIEMIFESKEKYDNFLNECKELLEDIKNRIETIK